MTTDPDLDDDEIPDECQECEDRRPTHAVTDLDGLTWYVCRECIDEIDDIDTAVPIRELTTIKTAHLAELHRDLDRQRAWLADAHHEIDAARERRRAWRETAWTFAGILAIVAILWIWTAVAG